ncbi:type III secretion system stator protein SctL [Erwinia sp. 9145]|uniref:type III secretion system stator protein SctL n=1 Tax=Erwinia sp. 9145 TaxID=1500895 RepID=UPI00069107E5|nr:type III secretion system stator protein SctL [Erwinia sp. 9145]
MWIRKKITLLSDPQLSQSNVLTREAIAEHQQALTVVQRAEEQALERIEQAERQASVLLDEARQRVEQALEEQMIQQQQDFITQAQQLFDHWQEQEQQWQHALMPRAEALLTQAMSQLLDEQPDAARLQAMLSQLVKAQGRQGAATLICAPAQQSAIEEWLAAHPQLTWEVSTDAALDDDALILTTGRGELHLSWKHIFDALLPAN